MHDPGPSRPPLRSPCAVDEEWIMAWVTNGQWRWWLADDLNVRLPSSLCGWWMARLSAHTVCGKAAIPFGAPNPHVCL